MRRAEGSGGPPWGDAPEPVHPGDPHIWPPGQHAGAARGAWDIWPAADAPDPGQPARPPGHCGRLRLVRSPLAWAVLLAGLAAAGGGAIALSHVTGRPGEVARPLAKAAPAPHGIFAAPPVHPGRWVSRPVELVIPAIGVRTPLVKLGRTPQGTLQVPPSTSVAGWYTGSPRPGQIGSAVIAGHIDSYAGPGVFFRLRLLRPGDRVYVLRADRSLAVFRVTAEHTYPKDHFPTQAVYGPEPDAELRLITCGGVFDPATGSYLSNVVVYASEVRHYGAPRHRHHRHHPRARHS
jgi:sortase (surface protein transpeptidase)